MKLAVPCACHLAVHYEWKQNFMSITRAYLTSPLSAIFSTKSHIEWAAAKLITLGQWSPNLFSSSQATWISYCSLYYSKETSFFFLLFYNNSPTTGFFIFTHLFYININENAYTFRSLRDYHQGVCTWYLFTFIQIKNNTSSENMSFSQLTIFRTVN